MGGRYVGIDLHRHRSVMFHMDATVSGLDGCGSRMIRGGCSRCAKAGPDAEVVIEATYGWYWAVGLFRDARFSVPSFAPVGQRLGEPSGEERGTRRA